MRITRIGMNVSEAIKIRKATRAFLSKAVDEGLIQELLDVARYAPSAVNSQPWQVAVVTGERKKVLSQKMLDAFQQGIKPHLEYPYYPKEWREPYKSRRKQTGMNLYNSLGITLDNLERRKAQQGRNFIAFDAPVMMFFFIDRDLELGSYLDYGMFLQSIMLAAAERGLATCPQVALAEYPEIVKAELGYEDSKMLLCGMAIGYEDTTAPENQYRNAREGVDSFTRFFY